MDSRNRHIPASRKERDELRSRIRTFAAERKVVPPVTLQNLEALADSFLQGDGLDPALREWTMVEMNNGLWLDTVSAIPYDRRLLLLPKCLSDSGHCEAEIDELGLLCHRCGRCTIPRLQEEADRYGMLSMVAEGFTSVVELIRNDVVDAVVGVSCLDSLEKAFPLLVGHAVPGLAVSLNDGGCHNTHVDEDYVLQLISAHADQEIKLLHYKYIQEEISQWFSRSYLSEQLSPADDLTTKATLDWMCGDGKRWRPFLLAAVYAALSGRTDFPDDVKKAAVAVECFHKASLIHDDIQDHDLERYGKPTMNAMYGDAMAINMGDLLLGEGYRMLAGCRNKELLEVVAEAHVCLCRGQGSDLGHPVGMPANVGQLLDIFRLKTAPAFEVSLVLGLLCAGGSPHLRGVLHEYSEALGIAYQLKDDLEDTSATVKGGLSIIDALRCENAGDTEAELREKAMRMADDFHRRVLCILGQVENLELKRLLFQITEKILK